MILINSFALPLFLFVHTLKEEKRKEKCGRERVLTEKYQLGVI